MPATITNHLSNGQAGDTEIVVTEDHVRVRQKKNYCHFSWEEWNKAASHVSECQRIISNLGDD